ncbi:M10 family metallopeptidase [Azohydromonas lata]|uniref:M10 family metallopeptidase n=1 Tax=Azohydromonas lata TaxID=45677 RepID=A0ABU5IDF6_9BURK|nr:M10 family metallopeptidase [Azohydromonas lata]MDZ5457144.1 M10 family metallopeptidase [Azohydromonas lata]
MPTPTGWSANNSAPLSSRTDVNSLIDGQRWATANLSYSFAGSGSAWSTDPNSGYGPRSNTTAEPWSPGYAALSTDNRAAVRTALAAWTNVSGLRFNEVTETASAVGDLRFAFSNLSDAQAWAYGPSDSAAAGDVWFDTQGTSRTDPWTPGSYEYQTAIHEIGHAIGLKHPFEAGSSNAQLIAASQNTRSLTVMSYSALPGRTDTWYSFEPTTPMLLDVAAIQTLYGANRQYNAANTTYAFSGMATYHQTIWDGGGTDTLRYDSTLGGLLDLREGQASRLGQAVNIESYSGVLQTGVKNVWIAYGTVIENATGGSGADEIIGNDAANLLLGGAGNDSLQGGAGNDTLDGGAGSDRLTGGSGNDVYTVDSTGDTVTETATAATEIDTVQSSVTWTLGANLEWLTLTGSAAINGTGNTLANRITGNAAANVLSGAAGNDTLLGGAGADTLDGGAGNDALDGGADIDTASYAAATAAVTVTLNLLPGTAQNTGGAGTDTLTAIENLTGSAFNDKLTGTAGANLLQGGAGNDTLLGGAANDTLDGGAGNDALDGGADADTASYAAATAAVTVSLLTALAQNTGGAGTDTLTAIENLTGSAFNDRLTGTAGANLLQGGGGNDVLLGDAGIDTLAGGAGLDTLTGGAGADTFDFNALADSGATATTCDVISDFSLAQGDRIDLRDVDANASIAGVQHFSGLVALSVAFSAPGQLHFDAAAHLLTANTDTDRDAEFVLKLTGVSSLSAAGLWLA